MQKTINIDFDNSSSVILGHNPDILSTPFSTGFAFSTHTHGSIHFELTNITASATSVSNGLTLALSVDVAGSFSTLTHDHGGTPSITGNIGGTIASNAWSLSIPDFLLTAAPVNHTHNYAGLNTSTATIAGSNVTLSLNTNGLTEGIPKYLTTAALSNHTHGVPVGVNITIGSSSDALVLSVGDKMGTVTQLATVTGSSIKLIGNTAGFTLSVPPFLTTASGGNYITLGGNTLGTATVISSGTATIAGGNNITLSQNGNAFTIIGAAAGTGGAGTGFSSTSTSGSLLKATQNAAGLSAGVPAWLTTAMPTNAGSNFPGLGSAITGGSMTYNSNGLSVNIPAGTAFNAMGTNVAMTGGSITGNTSGLSVNISVGTLMLSDGNGVSFGAVSDTVGTTITASVQSNLYMLTGFSSLFQLVANSSLSLGTNQSSLFQLVANASLSLGTGYSTHTHSNLYLPIGNSTQWNSSVLSNTFAVTNHTHSNLYIPVSASSAYQTATLASTFAVRSVVAGTGFTSTSTSGSNIVGTLNTSGLRLGIPNFLTTAATGSGGSNDGYNIIAAGGSTAATTGTIVFSNATGNGISFALYSGSRITAQHNAFYTSSQLTATFLTTAMAVSEQHIKGLGNTATIPFTSGSVMLSGVNLTVNTSSNGVSQYLQLSAPAIGYLFFSNTNGHSWSSSVNGMSTSVYIVT